MNRSDKKRKIVDPDFEPSKRARTERYDDTYICSIIMLNQKQEMLIDIQRKYIEHLEAIGGRG